LYSDINPDEVQEQSNLPISFIGYSLEDSEGQELGRIKKVLSYPMQTMFEIESLQGDSLSILIPFCEDWVIEILTEERILKMQLPEGLDTINS